MNDTQLFRVLVGARRLLSAEAFTEFTLLMVIGGGIDLARMNALLAVLDRVATTETEVTHA
jgi:hypothetical protein